MKSRTRIFSFVMMFSIAMLVGSCKKDSVLNPLNAGDCTKLIEDYQSALEAYLNNPSVATCEAYKSSLQDYADGCAGFAGYNATLAASIDDIDCSEEGN